MATVQTYDGTVRVIDGVVQLGCCCDTCCDEPGGPPTAAFSYAQTGDDPCTIDLTNESTDGTCGTINEYRWLLNGVEFSTAENPSGVVVENGDEITLEVTTDTGCTDSAVMVIACESLVECAQCPEDLPEIVTVNSSGWSNGTCTTCGEFNDTFVLPWAGVFSGICTYREGAGGEIATSHSCPPNPTTAKKAIRVSIFSSGVGFRTIRVSFTSYASGPGDGTHVFDLVQSTADSCRGTFNVPLVSCNDGGINCASAFNRCLAPASVSITI